MGSSYQWGSTRFRSRSSLILELIYINDLDDDILSWILKFADDTKIFSPADSENGFQNVQQDIDKLLDWSETWQMKCVGLAESKRQL